MWWLLATWLESRGAVEPSPQGTAGPRTIGLAEPASGHPVLFVLDEFAVLGHMETIEKAAGLMAGYGIKLWPILQDLTQLNHHYRESWETFLGNAGTLTFFGNTDLTSLEWLSKRMGQTEVSISDSSVSETASKGASIQSGTSTTSGTTDQEGSSEGASDMAPMNEVATVQRGATLLDTRRGIGNPLGNDIERQGQDRQRPDAARAAYEPARDRCPFRPRGRPDDRFPRGIWPVRGDADPLFRG